MRSSNRAKKLVCRCGAYPFPHMPGGGDCTANRTSASIPRFAKGDRVVVSYRSVFASNVPARDVIGTVVRQKKSGIVTVNVFDDVERADAWVDVHPQSLRRESTANRAGDDGGMTVVERMQSFNELIDAYQRSWPNTHTKSTYAKQILAATKKYPSLMQQIPWDVYDLATADAAANRAGKKQGPPGTVGVFLIVLSSKITQWDAAEEKRSIKRGYGYNIHALSLMMQALERVRERVRGLEERSDREAIGQLAIAMAAPAHGPNPQGEFFENFPPVKATLKQMKAWVDSGKSPSLIKGGGDEKFMTRD